MANKKSTTESKKVGRPPSRVERITDFSIGGYSGGKWTVKKPAKKK